MATPRSKLRLLTSRHLVWDWLYCCWLHPEGLQSREVQAYVARCSQIRAGR